MQLKSHLKYMNGIVHTLIVCEIKVHGLKKNYLLKQILCSLIFLDETLVDKHASAFFMSFTASFFSWSLCYFACLN